MKTALKSRRYKQKLVGSKKKASVNSVRTKVTPAELRSAMVDALRTERAMVREVITEVLEEEGLYRAIKEAEPFKEVPMETVMEVLRHT